MPIGAGACPAGSSPAGYGVPDKAFAPNNAILPGVRTGLPQSGRAIDPKTKSYYFASDGSGRLQGMATVPQLVQLALSTIKGSSAVAALGQTFSEVKEKGSDYAAQIDKRVRLAFADLIKRNLAQVQSVTVNQPPSNPDAGLAIVKWVDLTTGLVNTDNVGP